MRFNPETVIGIDEGLFSGVSKQTVAFEQMTEYLDMLNAQLLSTLKIPSVSKLSLISSSPPTEKLDLLSKPFTELFTACHDASNLSPPHSDRLYQRYGRSLRMSLAQAIPPNKGQNRSSNGQKSDALTSAAAQFSALEVFCMSLLPVLPLTGAHSWPSIIDMLNETAKEHIVDGNQIEISISIVQEVKRASSYNSIPKHANFINRCRDTLIPNLKDLLSTPDTLDDQPSSDIPSKPNQNSDGALYGSGQVVNPYDQPSSSVAPPVAPIAPSREQNKENPSDADKGMYLGRDIPKDGKCYVLTTKMTWRMPQNEGLMNYIVAFIEENLSLSMSNLARNFYDKCVADGKKIYGLQRNKDGKRPKVTNNDWMDKLFYPIHRNEALDVLKSPFRKILKMTFGIGAANSQSSDLKGGCENMMLGGLEWPLDGFQNPNMNQNQGNSLGSWSNMPEISPMVPDLAPIEDDFDDIFRGEPSSNISSVQGKSSLVKELKNIKNELEYLLDSRSPKIDVHFVKLYVTGHKVCTLDPHESAFLYLNYGKTLRKCLAKVIHDCSTKAAGDCQDPLDLAATLYQSLDSYMVGLVKCMPLDVLQDAGSWPSIKNLIDDTAREYIVKGNETMLVKEMLKQMEKSRSEGVYLRHSNFIDRCHVLIADLEGKIRSIEGGGQVVPDEDRSNSSSVASLPEALYGRDIPTDDTCYAFVPKATFTLKQNKGLKKYAVKVIGGGAHLSMEELTCMFLDKCIEDGKTLYRVELNEKGKSPKSIGDPSTENWMNHWFVKLKRNEAAEVLKGTFKKILKHCGGAKGAEGSRKSPVPAMQVSSENNQMIDRVTDQMCRVRMIDT